MQDVDTDYRSLATVDSLKNPLPASDKSWRGFVDTQTAYISTWS